ncbi:dihydroorotate oxidase A [Idiomarina loihiensis]|uniref:quinone-dependent dihydroorotate dehydrogenase n=1 Tax=Idiomarina TaxID=135575 RepID=UPI000D70B315|nr:MULTISPECIES: quinone-dependent dihydroorotate dehydrogenase [Idiomarina]PWW39165.1 dihydroorotate oxidase A [Idiomarina loihiensis]TDP49740.1 dihydroorotate oxidase A [Idiomarina loihiensis]TDS23946.1 dihydroorotate oxidase A [Idiomarina sp. H2]
MYNLIKPLLFRQDPEKTHELMLRILSKWHRTPLSLFWKQNVASKPVRVMGIDFPNPVGLAAGLDKNAECIDAFSQMGFGFIEVGTVTPVAQPGNDKPRLFRLTEDEAIINRMGFNNHGVDELVENVKASSYKGVLGINIGKNKNTPEEQAINDYLVCLNKVYPYASYVTINISSPNTPGLRNLQHGSSLDGLLSSLKEAQLTLAKEHDRYVPLVVKIAPDLEDSEIEVMAQSLLKNEMDGVIATNTTLSRDGLHSRQAGEAGGLSGKPLQDKSTRVIELLCKTLQRKIPVIGVGGIDSANSAEVKIKAGASLVQIYTGFIYQGPGLIRSIVSHL